MPILKEIKELKNILGNSYFNFLKNPIHATVSTVGYDVGFALVLKPTYFNFLKNPINAKASRLVKKDFPNSFFQTIF